MFGRLFWRCKKATAPPAGAECEGNKAMAKGMVKWFNADKGYGFIEPEGGGKDIFVHISQVQASELQSLENNQQIEFEMVDGVDGRQMAGNITLTE
jgi:CspA family cold shock protein